MIILNREFKTVNKDRLFYGQWHYAMSFYLREATCLRGLDHERIRARLDWIDDKLALAKQRTWSTGFPLIQNRPVVTRAQREALHDMTDYLLGTQHRYKLVVAGDSVCVYTNTQDLLDELDNQKFVQQAQYRQAVITREFGTIALKTSQHTHRTYFKHTKLTPGHKAQLHQFLINQPQVRCSPALQGWFAGSFMRLQDHHFIDHLGDADLIMLNLVHPGITRKTLQIKTR